MTELPRPSNAEALLRRNRMSLHRLMTLAAEIGERVGSRTAAELRQGADDLEQDLVDELRADLEAAP